MLHFPQNRISYERHILTNNDLFSIMLWVKKKKKTERETDNLIVKFRIKYQKIHRKILH